jgi:tetrahydromethanopterin S-methyltransferase subunit G
MDDLVSRVNDLENRFDFIESELTDKETYYELEGRIDKLENEVSYRDVYIYITVFYLIYLTSKQLNNIM